MAKPPNRDLNVKNPPSEDDEFASELAKRIKSVVGREHAAQVVAQVISLTQEERFQGPIAHPKHLREYEDILPGSADRIIAMAENQLRHSQAMQQMAIQADIQDAQDGRKYGFWALVSLVACALISGLFGHTVLAGLFLGAGALGTVGAFIKGRNGGPGS